VQRRFQSARDLRDALESWMRDTGRAVRPEDVGAWLGAIFADRRGRMQREIQRYMAEATRPHTGTTQSFSRAQVMSLASIEQMERAGGNPLEKLANLSSDSGASLVSSSMAGSQVGASIPSAIDASKRNRRVAAVAIAIAAVLAFGIALLVIAPWKKGPPPAPVTASTDTASAPTASPPATPAPPATPTPPATGAALASASATASPSASAPAPASPPPRYASTPAPPPRRPGPAPSRPSTPSAPPVAPDASPGFLTLDTYPWTRVTENGRVLGSTPLVHVQLSAGTHALMLDNPDQQIHQAYTVTIKSGETVSRRLGLR
jgi:serine/threonine-protein kinase